MIWFVHILVPLRSEPFLGVECNLSPVIQPAINALTAGPALGFIASNQPTESGLVRLAPGRPESVTALRDTTGLSNGFPCWHVLEMMGADLDLSV